jgi:hypothetical protein
VRNVTNWRKRMKFIGKKKESERKKRAARGER